MTENINIFNQVVGLMFDQFYRAFPIAEGVNYESMAAKLGVDAKDYINPYGVFTTRTREYGKIDGGADFEAFVDGALAFLVQEGFLHRDGGDYRLSAKSLTVLNAPLTGLGESLGTKLTGAVKSAGTEAGRAAISETVGQIIGATIKSVFN